MDDIPGGLVGKKVGNYTATTLIGRGSMGEVYQANHPILAKQVAIKVLSKDLSAYPELVSRFRREARAIAHIKHPSIVEAFDFGDTSDGRCYFVMELLSGVNLATFMHTKGALPIEEAVGIALPLMEGLAVAHEAGFIHRDIKPDNIFLVRTEEGVLFPKLIDFGIAKLRNPDEQGDSVVTRIDAVMGTPLYMSPEQAPGATEPVGAWSDIYSTAATLYHMICGKPPFYSDNPLELMLMHSWSQAPPVREVRADVPEAVSAVIMKGMGKKPGDRFASMQAFAEALRAALDGEGLPIPERPVATPPLSRTSTGRLPVFTVEPVDGDPDADDDSTSDTVLEGLPLVEVEGALIEDDSPEVSSPVALAAEEEKAPEPSRKAGSGQAPGESPSRHSGQDRRSVNSSLSGVASEVVVDAAPPSATLFQRRRSPLPWILGGAALVVGAVLAFVFLGGEKKGASGPARYVLVSAKTLHTCAIEKGSSVVTCWGRNNYGQLGVGDTQVRTRPERVKGIGEARQVSAGGRHTCALLVDGSVHCWGRNDAGQLGDGTTTDRLAPVPVKDLGGSVAISAGADHTCALLEENTLRCWGKNDLGQLGLGKKSASESLTLPVRDLQAILAVSAGGFHTCALAANGAVWCWGRNDLGQLGLGDTEDRLQPARVEGLEDISALSSGGTHTCALTRPGGVHCWGDNATGQLGRTAPPMSSKPVAVSGLSSVRLVSAGGGYLVGHTCAVTEEDQLFCWGNNAFGQLGGEPSKGRHPQPRAVAGLKKVQAVAAGGRHTCGLNGEGELFCWGDNGEGQLGDGTGTSQVAPRPVP